MKSVLFIVSKSEQTRPDYQFLFTSHKEDQNHTIVLLNNGIIDEQLGANKVYILNEDQSRNKPEFGEKAHASYPSISYRNLLDLIFVSDSSVVI